MNKFTKIISVMLAVVLVVMAIPFTTFAAQTGDVNGDGNVLSTDARLVLQVVAGLVTKENLENADAADLNNDGNITSADARIILQVVAGLQDAPIEPETPTEPETPDEPQTPESDPLKAEMVKIFNETSAVIAKGSYKWEKECYYIESLKVDGIQIDAIKATVDKFLGIGRASGTEKDAGKYAMIPMNLKESDIEKVYQDGKYITICLNDAVNPAVGGDTPLSHITKNIVTKADVENELKAVPGATVDSFQANYTRIELIAEVSGDKCVSLLIRYDLDANLGVKAVGKTITGSGKARTEIYYTDMKY